MAISYRESLYRDYQSSLDEALRQVGMRERLAGKPLSPAERASIIQGILMPYSSQYAGGLEAEAARAQEQERLEMQKEQMKQQQEAAEMAGYAQLGSLGLAGAQYYSTHSGGGGAGASGSSSGGGGGGAYGTSGTWYGNAAAFGGGLAAGYYASPYGQQAEEGTGGLSRYPYKPIGSLGGGGSRRTGQRLGMVSVGAGAGYLGTGGNPYGAAGGFIGGYLQENPETGKRGYQEDWEYRIKPAYQGTIQPAFKLARRTTAPFTDKYEQPVEQTKKILKKFKVW